MYLCWFMKAVHSVTPCSIARTDITNSSSVCGSNSLRHKCKTNSVSLQGSGWGWLAAKRGGGKLFVVTTANQDPLSVVAPVCHPPVLHAHLCLHILGLALCDAY
jgi:hypothetical protein